MKYSIKWLLAVGLWASMTAQPASALPSVQRGESTPDPILMPELWRLLSLAGALIYGIKPALFEPFSKRACACASIRVPARLCCEV